MRVVGKIAILFASVGLIVLACDTNPSPVQPGPDNSGSSSANQSASSQNSSNDETTSTDTQQNGGGSDPGDPDPPWAGDPLTPHASIRAFPGAEGFGAYAFGGRGDGTGPAPRIIPVTTLQDRVQDSQTHQMVTAPGSLREALEASGPRFIVFNVQGTIYLDDPLEIKNPFVTVAGQTAGGDGIVLSHWGLRVHTHDVVLRYLRIRVLYEESDGMNGRYMDCVTIYRNDFEVSSFLDTVYNVIIDHCSFAWAIDENLDVWNWVRNITIQWCVISNGSMYGHELGPHASGMIVSVDPASTDDGTKTLGSLHHNLFAHNKQRSPLVTSGDKWDCRNNVVYNWYYWDPIELAGNPKLNLVGNYLIAGLDVSTFPLARNAVKIPVPSTGIFPLLHLHDNIGPMRSLSTQDEWDIGVAYRVPNVGGLCGNTGSQCIILVGPDNYQSQIELTEPLASVPVTTQSPDAALASVLGGAGATKPRRDTVDGDLVAEIGHVLSTGTVDPSDPVLKRLGPHHGPSVDVLWFHPDSDPSFACVPRQKRLSPGDDVQAVKLAMLTQMNCTLPGGIQLPQDAAYVLANPGLYTFDIIQRTIPDRATVDSLYLNDESPSTDQDSDGDHIPDAAEAAIGSSPSVDDSLLDSNGDGYLNIEEYLNSL